MNTHYSGLSKINHWFTVILVTVMLTLGYMMLFAAEESTEGFLKGAHISIGFFAFWFLLWRTVYRLKHGFPKTHSMDAKGIIARGVHYLILLSLVVLVISGPLYLFTENEAVAVFNWFSVQFDLTALKVIHEPAEEVHKLFGLYLLPVLLAIHILAATFEYLVNSEQ